MNARPSAPATLKQRLTLAHKLALRRWFVGGVRSVLRLGLLARVMPRGVVDLAVKNGLDLDRLSGPQYESGKIQRDGRINVLVVEDRVPTPDRDAGGARMMHILQSLSAWSRVVFVPVSIVPMPEYEKPLRSMSIEIVSAAEYLRVMRERHFDIAIVSRPDVAEAVIPTLRRKFPRTRVIFDMVDVHFVRLERKFALSGDPSSGAEARRYRILEPALAAMSDQTWCASIEDERAMNEHAPATPTIVIPTIHAIKQHNKSFDDRSSLLFIGNMSHSPNVDSVQFLVHDIMPLVNRDLPDLKLYVVGANMGTEFDVLASETVKVLGHVPDLEPLLAGCRLMVAPLRFGAGMKGKIGESMAHGLPVVTTPIGAESIGIRHEEEAMIAGTADDIAAAVVRAYTDKELWQRLERQGRSVVEAKYTPEVVGQLIRSAIDGLLDR